VVKERIMRGEARGEADPRTAGLAAGGSWGVNLEARPAGVVAADWAVGEQQGCTHMQVGQPALRPQGGGQSGTALGRGRMRVLEMA
jgi:hypothetical protein